MDYKEYLALPQVRLLKQDKNGCSNYFAALRGDSKVLEIDKYDNKTLAERWFFEKTVDGIKWLKYDIASKKRTSRAFIKTNYSSGSFSDKSKVIANKFFNIKNGLYGILDLQERKLNKKKCENEDYIYSVNCEIDSLPLPKGLEDWVHTKVINGDRYIFYKFEKEYSVGIAGEREDTSHYNCYCTRCNQSFPLWKKPVHNDATFCPECGEASTYKAEGLSRNKLTHTANIAFPQSVDGENFVVRCFHVARDYSGNYKNIHMRIKEFSRYYFTKTRVWYSKKEAKYGMSNVLYSLNYFQLVNKFEIFDGAYWFYNDILQEVLGKSYLARKISAIQEFIQSQKCVRNNLYNAQIELLRHLTMFPTIEYLIKQKFYGFVTSILNNGVGVAFGKNSALNIKGKTPESVLGMPSSVLKQFNDYSNIRVDGLHVAQYCVNNKLVEYYQQIKSSGYNAVTYLEKIEKVVPIRKVLNYLKNHDSKISLNDYYDYISGCQQLNYDLNNTTILKPKDFKTAHDALLVLIKVQANALLETSVKAAYDTYSKLVQWSDGNIQVMLAKDCADIIREGQQQNHCVGRYCERVAKGESLILFLRRTAEHNKGFYTMEIRPDMRKLNNVQCRGYGNEDTSPETAAEVADFLKRYEKWFNKRSSKGFDSSRVIAKYYKSVRKMPDGKYISINDYKTEFKVGEVAQTEIDTNPDRVHVKGLHIASLEFAQKFGGNYSDVAILEVEVNLNDVIVPDAVDQIRTSKFKVLREVPLEEMGEWGKQRLTTNQLRQVG